MIGGFMIGARIAINSLPETRTVVTLLVRLAAVPLLTALFYVMLATGGTTALTPADALAASLAVGAIQATVATCSLLATDRFEGTSTFHLTAPRPPIMLSAGRLSVPTIIGFVTGSITSVSLLLVSAASVSPSGWALALLTVATAVLGSVGLGYFLAALSLSLRDSLVTANLAGYFLPLVCGVVAPLTLFPAWAQIPLGILPLSHGTTAAREFMTSGTTSSAWFSLTLCMLTGIGWAVVGAVVWRLQQRRALRIGTAEFLQ
ncbi:ABC transporter permease [Microbacterium sp. NPDC056052]|uniref:ABC transporter permease n=1 Tax=Microbacterium sp. NPDC056052 TaxID=3345695 RepID=UPI0035E1271B